MKYYKLIFIIILILFILKKNQNKESFRNVSLTNEQKQNIFNKYQVFLINLDRSPDRLKNAKQNLPFTFERFKAFDGKQIDLYNLHQQGYLAHSSLKDTNMSIGSPSDKTNRKLTHGAVGCYLSHTSLWEHCVLQNEPIIILEDDIGIKGNKNQFYKNIDKFMNQIPNNWDIIFFGYHDYNKGFAVKESINENTCKLIKNINGLHAYMIHPKAAKILLKDSKPIKMQVDAHTNKYYPQLNVYGCPDSMKFFGYSYYGTTIQGKN